MEKIVEVLKEVRVVAITEIKHKEGIDFPDEKQDIFNN